MILIGEDLNVMAGEISRVIKEREPGPIQKCVTEQMSNGMDYLDVNVGPVKKDPEGTMDWRPTPGQRSTLELMQYMTCMSEIMAVNAITGNWDHAPALSEKSQKVYAGNFAAAMDAQMARVAEVLGDIDEASATSTMKELPWKEPIAVSALLMRGVYASLVAYRMQFFLYAKQSGNAEIGTVDCWAGMSGLPGA